MKPSTVFTLSLVAGVAVVAVASLAGGHPQTPAEIDEECLARFGALGSGLRWSDVLVVRPNVGNLDNRPDAAQALRLRQLCHHVLGAVPGPYVVAEGFRRHVSQRACPLPGHDTGQALDVVRPGVPNAALAWMLWTSGAPVGRVIVHRGHVHVDTIRRERQPQILIGGATHPLAEV